MAMKETVGSLRAYFGVVGLFNFYSGVMQFGQAKGSLFLQVFSVVMLGLSVAYLFCAFKLPDLLANNLTIVETIIYITLGVNVGIGLLIVLASGQMASISRPIIAIVVALYLLSSVRRLSQEA